jgi:hypothetical protein
MPRIIVLALLFVSVPAIGDAAPIRIAYKGRFVDLERRGEPNGPFYCDVHGEFVLDEALPDQQMVVSASMVIPDKGMTLLAPAAWPSIMIENNVRDGGNAFPDGQRDQIRFGALFPGWNGVVYEDHDSSGYELEAPSRDPDVAWFVRERGYGIMFSLIGPTSWFDPVANPITRLQGLATYDRI